MSSPPKPRVQRDRQRDQYERSSPPKIDFGIDGSDLMPPVRAPYVLHKSTSVSSGSTASSPDRERGPIAYPNYYDYADPEPQHASSSPRSRQNGHSPHRDNMANMAMQVPIQQQQGQGRLIDNARNSGSSGNNGPVTTQQIAQAARNNGGAPRGSRPPSYSGSQHGPRSPEDPPLNKVDIDAARYRQTQQRRPQQQQPATKDGRPPTNGSNRAPSSGGGGGGMVGGRPISPESPLLSPAAHIQRLPTPSITSSVLQPLDAKVTEYGALMAEAQADMAALDEEMRLLQDRQREAEARFLDAKSKHDDYRRQYHDVERALRGDFSNGTGMPPMPSMPNLTGSRQDMMDGPRGGMHQGGGPQMGGQPPAMRSQRTVSAHSEQPSMMSQESVRTQKRGRFSRIFGV